jgi:adenylate cyclase class IV
MRETELKAVVPDESVCQSNLQRAGAVRVTEGRLEDRRYDFPDRRLTMKDLVLRLRVRHEGADVHASLDWKGAASFEAGYKHRDETTLVIEDHEAMARILGSLGMEVTRAIDRDVSVMRLGRATLRFERFARMDTLLEVEGPEDAIEDAIRASGLPRSSFLPDRLYMFVQRFENRTGQRAAICDAELHGEYRFRIDDA